MSTKPIYMLSFFNKSPKFPKADLVHLLHAAGLDENVLDYIIAVNKDHIVFNNVQPSRYAGSSYIAGRSIIHKADLIDARSKSIFNALHADLVRLSKNRDFLGHYLIHLAYYYEGGVENLNAKRRPAAAAAAARYNINDPLGFGMSMSRTRNTIRRGSNYGSLGQTHAEIDPVAYEAALAGTRSKAYSNYLKSMTRRGSRSRSRSRSPKKNKTKRH